MLPAVHGEGKATEACSGPHSDNLVSQDLARAVEIRLIILGDLFI